MTANLFEISEMSKVYRSAWAESEGWRAPAAQADVLAIEGTRVEGLALVWGVVRRGCDFDLRVRVGGLVWEAVRRGVLPTDVRLGEIISFRETDNPCQVIASLPGQCLDESRLLIRYGVY